MCKGKDDPDSFRSDWDQKAPAGPKLLLQNREARSSHSYSALSILTYPLSLVPSPQSMERTAAFCLSSHSSA